MSVVFDYFPQQGYLKAVISDRVITLERARAILFAIGEECLRLDCRRVLLDELSVECRNIARHEIVAISKTLPKISLAFLCRPELIDDKSTMLSVFTFTHEYVVKHFSELEAALSWLLPEELGSQ